MNKHIKYNDNQPEVAGFWLCILCIIILFGSVYLTGCTNGGEVESEQVDDCPKGSTAVSIAITYGPDSCGVIKGVSSYQSNPLAKYLDQIQAEPRANCGAESDFDADGIHTHVRFEKDTRWDGLILYGAGTYSYTKDVNQTTSGTCTGPYTVEIYTE